MRSTNLESLSNGTRKRGFDALDESTHFQLAFLSSGVELLDSNQLNYGMRSSDLISLSKLDHIRSEYDVIKSSY